MKLESEVTGYLGTTIIAPGGSSSSVRYVMDSFADKASLCAGKFRGIAQANRRSGCSTYDRVTGLETWLSLPDLKTIAAPSRWKMAIVTFTGV